MYIHTCLLAAEDMNSVGHPQLTEGITAFTNNNDALLSTEYSIKLAPKLLKLNFPPVNEGKNTIQVYM